ERAAELHAQVQRAESVAALAAPLVQPMDRLRALVLQAAAEPDSVAVFLFEGGRLRGPALYSTLGMRIQNEQSGSSSLFAAPMAVEAVEEQGRGTRDEGQAAGAKAARGVLEARLEAVLGELAAQPDATATE